MDESDLATVSLCDSCGSILDGTIQQVEFYCLPLKVTRKVHKDKGRKATYCSGCWDGWDRVPYFVDGTECSLPKYQRFQPCNMVCQCCLTGLGDILPGLYGIIAATTMIDGSVIESCPLAVFCRECVDEKQIELSR